VVENIILAMLLGWLGYTAAMTIRAGVAKRERELAALRGQRVTGAPTPESREG
jgi:hypothetical protein